MRNLTEGIVVILIGLGAVWGAYQVPPAQDGETWAGLVPMIVAVCLMVGGILMAVGNLKKASTAKTEVVENASSPSAAIFAIALLAVVYQYVISAFGYLLPTAFVAPAILYIFGVRSVVGLAVSMVLCPLIFHVIFFELLGVFPPYGTVFEPLDLIRS